MRVVTYVTPFATLPEEEMSLSDGRWLPEEAMSGGGVNTVGLIGEIGPEEYEQRVRVRAHALWMCGYEENSEVNWYEAERQLEREFQGTMNHAQ